MTAQIIWLMTVTPAKLKKTGAQEKKDNKMIRTRSYTDNGRESRCVEVKIEGVPVTGLIDTGSDITIVEVICFTTLCQQQG